MTLSNTSCVFITAILLLFGSLVVLEVQSQKQLQILFVKANKSQDCPDNIGYVSCETFDYYYKNMSFWCKANTEMLFQEGQHYLDEFITASNCHNFSMSGMGNVSLTRDSQPNPSAQIICHKTLNNSGLYFSESTNISVHNLEIDSCGGSPLLKKNHHVQLTSALAFTSVKDLIVSQSVISNAIGYALYLNNSFGTIVVVQSVFSGAKGHPYTNESGNAKFSFCSLPSSNTSDGTRLVVNSSWFMNGENDPRKLPYYGGAGGLNVYINGTTNVHVYIFNVTAMGNKGGNGNMFIHLVDDNLDGNSVVINKSHIVDGRGEKGGGLQFRCYSSYDHVNKVSYKPRTHQILTVVDSVFRNNLVNQTGGAMYLRYHNSFTLRSYDGKLRLVNITNCSFTENGGDGAAMEIIEHFTSSHRALPLYRTVIENCHFERNFILVDGPILYLIAVDVTITNSTFTENVATVMTLRDTYLSLRYNVLFANNRAVIGGAIKLCDSSLIFGHNKTNVTFVNNKAQKGGAIYIQQSCMDTPPLCFFQPSYPKGTSIAEFNMNLTFKNNSAQIVGNDIYGGDLDRCTTMVPFTKKHSSKKFNYRLYSLIMKEVFDMQGPSSIASDPLRACFCLGADINESNHNICVTEREPIEVYPGEQFSVSVIAVGQLNRTTYGTVNATLVDEHPTNHSLNRLNHLEASSGCKNLTFSLSSKMNSAQINFSAETTELATHYMIKQATLNVTILQCPLGFQLREKPPYTCTCNREVIQKLKDHTQSPYLTVTCNVTSQVITVPSGRLWLGCFDPNLKNDTAKCTSLVMTPNCNYDCRKSPDFVNISISNLDSQCSEYHTGIMCGACKDGHSRILGNIFECRKDCSNANLTFLILIFLASGFLLVFVIMTLNLTVTEGTLNGLLVYTMVIQTTHTFPAGFGKFCWIFISWINLTIGFSTCFYKGMDAYQYIWVIFAQAFYFLLIQALIVFLSRKYIFFTRLFGKNIVNVLATLFLLLYSNLAYGVIATFRFARMYYSTENGTLPVKYAWHFDANVPYLGRKHAPLFVVALFWSIFMMLFLVSLLMIQCLQRQTSLWCFRWVTRLRPFYEAFTGPCRDNYRFWPGFLLFIKVGLFIMNSLIPQYNATITQIKMFMTAGICVIVMSLACIFPYGVYKKWSLNVLEFSFFLNICITSGLLGLSRHRKNAIVYTSVSIAAMTFLGILVYHLHSQIKKTKIWSKVTTWLSVRRTSTPFRYISRRKRSSENNDVTDTDADERDHLLPQSLPSVVKFEDFREPLIED